MQISSRKHAESLDYDRRTDREIQRMDFEFKAKIARIKEEKDRRHYRRASESRKNELAASYSSSGYLKNFMRPYNPAAYSTSKKHGASSIGALTTHRSASAGSNRHTQAPTPHLYTGANTAREGAGAGQGGFDLQQELNPEQFNSK